MQFQQRGAVRAGLLAAAATAAALVVLNILTDTRR